MAGPRSNEPGMSYRRMLNLYVTTQDGEKCSVVTCPAGAFQVLLLVALETIPKVSARQTAAKLIASLDFTGPNGDMDRFFAINELVLAGAAIPLFAQSKEPARSGGGRKKESETMGEMRNRQPGIQGIDSTVPYHLALPMGL